MFNKLIKFIEIDVGKKLGGQIANWYSDFAGIFTLSLSLSLSLVNARVTLDNCSQEPHRIWVFNLSTENLQQNCVVDALKEFLDVAFKNVARAVVVPARLAQHFLDRFYSSVRPSTQPARKRGRNKSWIENQIQNSEYGVMQNPIANRGLMNVARFRVANPKTSVGTVAISLPSQFSMELKNVFFQPTFKSHHVWPNPLVSLKNIPGQKQVCGINY